MLASVSNTCALFVSSSLVCHSTAEIWPLRSSTASRWGSSWQMPKAVTSLVAGINGELLVEDGCASGLENCIIWQGGKKTLIEILFHAFSCFFDSSHRFFRGIYIYLDAANKMKQCDVIGIVVIQSYTQIGPNLVCKRLQTTSRPFHASCHTPWKRLGNHVSLSGPGPTDMPPLFLVEMRGTSMADGSNDGSTSD